MIDNNDPRQGENPDDNTARPAGLLQNNLDGNGKNRRFFCSIADHLMKNEWREAGDLLARVSDG